MSTLSVTLVPSRTDNYIFLLHNADKQCVIIDPGESAPVIAALETHGLTPKAIWLTHHHYDHIDGVGAMKKAFPDIEITGFSGDAHRLPPLDVTLNDGDMFRWSNHEVLMRHVPGHTLGHVFYHIPAAEIAFVGDTLFAMGCGRLFEGDAAMMYTSLQTIAQMPDATRIYCAHEYTQANASFALSLEPSNPHLVARADEIAALRAADTPTIPTSVAAERATNPFLRAMSAEMRQNLALPDSATEIETFAAIRAAKDTW